MSYFQPKLSLPAFPFAARIRYFGGGSFAAIALLAVAVLPLPSRAQVVASMDARGKVVFTNDDSPNKRTGGTISSPSGAPRAVPMGRTSPAVSGVPVAVNTRLDSIVQAAAERNKLDPALVKAVINTESGWNPHAISSKGAVGLMQLIPATAQRYGVGNAFDPAQNVEGGSKYLRSLLDRYNGDLTKSLAAYNAGERAVDLSNGVPQYRETQRYVQKVTDAYFQPDSGRDFSLWQAPRTPVRREVESTGRLVFTNQ